MGWVADLLKEIPSAAKYKAEMEAMEKENTALKAEKTASEAEIVVLRQELERKNDIVQEYFRQIQGARIDEVKEKILSAIAYDTRSTDGLLKAVGLASREALSYHLRDPRMAGLVYASWGAVGSIYSLTTEGQEYCVTNGLLKVTP
jgi:hypothetical protein